MDITNNDYNKLLEAVRIFTNIYETIRIVNPLQNKVVFIEDRKQLTSEDTCYEFWRKDKFCENCVSLRAMVENATFVKFEIINERIFMITASPVEYLGQLYCLEMMNDITNKGIFENIAGKNPKDFTSLVLRLNDALVRDELTQLFNRRYINERLPVEMIQCYAENLPAVLVIGDIDLFKKVNDQYGHSAGDVVLKQIGAILKAAVHAKGNRNWAARYGGEEFLLFLHNISGEAAFLIVDEVRRKIEQTEFKLTGTAIHLTSSFGLYSIQPKLTLQQWIDEVDKRLYAAKAQGGNRIEV